MKGDPYIRKKKQGTKIYYVVEQKIPLGDNKYKTKYIKTLGDIWNILSGYGIDASQFRQDSIQEKSLSASEENLRQDSYAENNSEIIAEVPTTEIRRTDAEELTEAEIEQALLESKEKGVI